MDGGGAYCCSFRLCFDFYFAPRRRRGIFCVVVDVVDVVVVFVVASCLEGSILFFVLYNSDVFALIFRDDVKYHTVGGVAGSREIRSAAMRTAQRRM